MIFYYKRRCSVSRQMYLFARHWLDRDQFLSYLARYRNDYQDDELVEVPRACVVRLFGVEFVRQFHSVEGATVEWPFQ
jgi:hypothetical protein